MVFIDHIETRIGNESPWFIGCQSCRKWCCCFLAGPTRGRHFDGGHGFYVLCCRGSGRPGPGKYLAAARVEGRPTGTGLGRVFLLPGVRAPRARQRSARCAAGGETDRDWVIGRVFLLPGVRAARARQRSARCASGGETDRDWVRTSFFFYRG